MSIYDHQNTFYNYNGFIVGVCSCNKHWIGDGCWTAECPLNCSGRGICNDSVEVPFCTQCNEGWMGADCNTPCYGKQIPMDSGMFSL